MTDWCTFCSGIIKFDVHVFLGFRWLVGKIQSVEKWTWILSFWHQFKGSWSKCRQEIKVHPLSLPFYFIYWLRLALTHWILKTRLAEVNQFTGNCFRKVRIVSKNNIFEVNISRLTSLDSLSILLWSPGDADLRLIIAKRKIRGLLKNSEGLNTCQEYWEIFSLITCSGQTLWFQPFRPTESQPVSLSIFVHFAKQLDSQPANIWIGLLDNFAFSQSVSP